MLVEKMDKSQNIEEWRVPVLKFGVMLGIAYTLALYLFYYGGKTVFFDESFQGVTQFLTIIGIYLGMSHCSRLFPFSRFWKLFLYGIVILGIAIVFKIVFSYILYNVLEPDLGIAYKEELLIRMDDFYGGLGNEKLFNKNALSRVVSPLFIVLMEGISLFLSGTLFTVFIALILNMFRRRLKK